MVTDVLDLDEDPADCNWAAILRRDDLPTVDAPESAEEVAYSPYQPRRSDGKFGRGSGSSGVGVGVSRERPELGGSDVHTYGDLEAARKNPVIAKAERETDADLAAMGIDVASQRQVAGVFEGGGEPSLMLTLSKGSSLEDVDVGAAYMVRRNEQDSVITNVMGPEMERLGLQPNGKLVRITGLPTDTGSRERIFKEIQDSTPFASWDEKAGTVEVSYFDADLSRDTVRGLGKFSAEHGGSMTLEPTHTRWTFHDDATRDGAREYLNPGDDSVLRTAGDVIAQYPGDRTARIPGVRGGPRPVHPGGGGEGPSASLVWDHDAGAGPQGDRHGGLTPWAYTPGQKRDTKGRFGSGGGTSAPAAPSGGTTDGELIPHDVEPRGTRWVTGGTGTAYPGKTIEHELTREEATAALKEFGVSADLRNLDATLTNSVVHGFADVEAQHPALFRAVNVHVQVTQARSGDCYAETSEGYSLKFSGRSPDYKTGHMTITLHEPRWQAGFGEQLRDDLQRDEMTNWHPVGAGTPEGTIYHEMGHVFDAALDNVSYPPSTYTGPNRVTKFGGYGKLVADQNAGASPSNYGKKNATERFAEEFAALTADRATDIRTGYSPTTPGAKTVDELMKQHR